MDQDLIILDEEKGDKGCHETPDSTTGDEPRKILWNDPTIIEELKYKGPNPDVYLASGEERFPAHSQVLGRFPHFKRLLDCVQPPPKLPNSTSYAHVIEIPCDPIILELILGYLYNGQMTFIDDGDLLLRIHHASVLLKIPFIKKMCLNHMLDHLNGTNWLDFLRLVENEPLFLQALFVFLSAHFPDDNSHFVHSYKFTSLTENELQIMLKSKQKPFQNEELKLLGVINWVYWDPETRSSCLDSLVNFVKLHKIEKERLREMYTQNPVLHSNKMLTIFLRPVLNGKTKRSEDLFPTIKRVKIEQEKDDEGVTILWISPSISGGKELEKISPKITKVKIESQPEVIPTPPPSQPTSSEKIKVENNSGPKELIKFEQKAIPKQETGSDSEVKAEVISKLESAGDPGGIKIEKVYTMSKMSSEIASTAKYHKLIFFTKGAKGIYSLKAYSFKDQKYKKIAESSFLGMENSTLTVVGNKLFSIGGTKPSGYHCENEGKWIAFLNSRAQVCSLDLTSWDDLVKKGNGYPEWSPGPQMLEPKSDFPAIVIGNVIYTYGGCNAGDISNSVEKLEVDAKGGKWEENIEHLEYYRQKSGAVQLGSRIYIVGGEGFRLTKDLQPPKALMAVEAFDLGSQEQIILPYMKKRRSAPCVVAFQDKIWVLGGIYKDTKLRLVEVYDPEGNYWSFETPMKRRRAGGCAFVIGAYIYAIGGDEDEDPPTIEIYSPHTRQWTLIHSKLPRNANLFNAAIININQ